MTSVEVVTAYAQALSTGDVPTAFAHFSSGINWHQPGNNRFSGVKRGAEEIGRMLGAMMEATKGSFALKSDGNIMSNGAFVAMPVRFSGTIEDRHIDMRGVDLFEVKDGKITGVWLFSDDQGLEDEFWGV